MRPHTPAEAGAVCDAVGRWQERLSIGCSAAAWSTPRTSTTCWPGASSRRPPPTTASPSTRTASAWRGPSSGPSTASRGAPRRAPRLLRLGRRRPGRGLPGARGPAAPRCPAPRARRRGRSTVVTGDLRRPRCSGRCSPATAGPRARCWPWTTRSSAATSAWPGSSPGPTWPGPWPASPTGPRYLLPDACLSEGRFLDGTHRRRPAPAGRGGPSDGASLRAVLDGRRPRRCRPGRAPARPAPGAAR